MGKNYISKVGLDVTDWKTGISAIKRDNTVIESGFKAVSSGLDNWTKSAAGLAARQESLNKKIENHKKIVGLLEDEYTKVIKKYGEGSKEADNFAIKLNRAKEALGKSEKNLRKTNQSLEEYDNEMEDAVAETKKFGKVTNDAEKESKSFGKTLGKVGGIAKKSFSAFSKGVSAVGVNIVATGKKLLDFAGDAAAVTDEIDKQSQKMGLSRKAYQEWNYIAGQSGAELSSLQGGFADLAEKMESAKTGTGDAADAFRRLGLNPNQFRTQEEAFEAIVQKMQLMEDGAEKASLAKKLLGTAGEELMPLLNAEAGSVENLKQKAHELGLVLSDEAVDAGVKYTDSIDSMKKSFKGFKTGIVADMLPGLGLIADGLTGVITGQEGAEDKIADGAKGIISSIVKVLPKLSTLFTSVISAVAAVAPDIISTLADGILKALPNLLNVVSDIIPSISSTLISAIPILITAIQTILPELVSAGADILFGLIDGLITALPDLLNVVLDIINEVLIKLGEVLPNIIKTVIKIIPQIVKSLTKFIPLLIKTGIDLFIALVEAMPEIISEIVGVLPDIIKSIIKAILDLLPLIIIAGIQLFVSLIKSLPKIIVEIVKAIPDIIAAIIEGFGDYFSDMGEIGLNLVKGIWKGIVGAATWIKDKISGFVGDIIKSFKKGFDINSPSGEGEDIGEMVGVGVGGGISKSIKGVLGKVKSLRSQVLGSLTMNSEALAAGNNYTTNETNNNQKIIHQKITYQAASKKNDQLNMVDLMNKLRGVYAT